MSDDAHPVSAPGYMPPDGQTTGETPPHPVLWIRVGDAMRKAVRALETGSYSDTGAGP